MVSFKKQLHGIYLMNGLTVVSMGKDSISNAESAEELSPGDSGAVWDHL